MRTCGEIWGRTCHRWPGDTSSFLFKGIKEGQQCSNNSVCLACIKPRVPSLAPKSKETTTKILIWWGREKNACVQICALYAHCIHMHAHIWLCGVYACMCPCARVCVLKWAVAGRHPVEPFLPQGGRGGSLHLRSCAPAVRNWDLAGPASEPAPAHPAQEADH